MLWMVLRGHSGWKHGYVNFARVIWSVSILNLILLQLIVNRILHLSMVPKLVGILEWVKV